MMSLTKAKTVAKTPEAFSTEELDDAMTAILESDRLSETQVTNLLNKIDPVMRARLSVPAVPVEVTYPARTAVTEIQQFDRSTKVTIQCLTHPASEWMTKDPYSSRWFASPRNCTPFGTPLSDCECGISNYVTSEPYSAPYA